MANWMWLWLAIGLGFCAMEVVLPTAFVEMSMGVSALIVALLTAFVPGLNLQIGLWMVLSLVSVVAVKRLLPPSRPQSIDDATEAEALTAMEPGDLGRVMFEGNSWRAKCEGDRAISPSDRAIVVGREGNTLLVMHDDLS